MKKIYILTVLLFCLSCYNQEKNIDNNKLLGNDYRLFQGTSVWNLAKAVQEEDIVKIKEELNQKKIQIDYREPKFGKTLLMLAINNNLYNSVKVLLELGANPNLSDKVKGANSVIFASQNEDPKYLKIVLAFNGNPNSTESLINIPVNEIVSLRNSALTAAIFPMDDQKKSLEKIKMLVEAGANIDYFNEDYIDPVLSTAIIQGKFDVVLYLLQKGANYNLVMYKMLDEDRKVYILEALRKSILDMNSNNYKKKMEVISFLKNKGLDYDKEPISEKTLEQIKQKYPDKWQKYVEKY